MRSTRRLAAPPTLLALLTACQSTEREPSTPTATIAASTPPAPSPSPSASPPPSPSPSPSPEDYTVPAVIDEPYVQRVLTALYNLESEAVRQMVAAGEVTPEAEALVRAVNRSAVVDRYLESYRADASENFSRLLQPPGNQRIILQELVSVVDGCIFARANRDYVDVLVDPAALEGQTFVQLLPKTADQDFGERNPTPWIIGGSVLQTDGSQPENPCAP